MRKRKVLLAVLSLVLSCAFVAGCAKSQYMSIGKTKYDAVLYAADNYAIAVEKGKTYIYKDGKKLNKTAFYEAYPIKLFTGNSDYYAYTNAAFIVSTERGAKPQILSGTTGELMQYEYEITDITAYTVESEFDTRVAGYIATVEADNDNGKVAISASSLKMSARYYDVDFENGFFTGITFGAGQDDTSSLSVFVDKDGSFETVFTETADESLNSDYVVDEEVTGNALFYYQKDSAGGNFAYGIAGVNGEIDSGCSVPRSLGMGYFDYDKKRSDGVLVTQVITPEYETVSIGEAEVLGASYDKVFVRESNSENKSRIKELISGKTTDYYDETMYDEESEIIGAYSGEKTLFFNNDFEKITEFNATVYDSDITVDGDSTVILAECEKADGERSICAYVNGVVTDRPLGDYNASFLDGAVYLQNNDGKKLWIPYTNYEITLSAESYNPVTPISTSGFQTETLYYALDTGAGKPWIVAASNLKYLESSRSATNDIAAVMGISDENYTAYNFSCGSVSLVDIMNKTAYELSYNGVTAFVGDNAMPVNYITYRSGSTVKTVLSYGVSAKNHTYNFIGDKTVSAGVSSMGGTLFTATSASTGKTTVYRASKTDGNVEVKAVLENAGKSRTLFDMFGEYVFVEVGGKTAVYDADGNLLLAPKYKAEEISNGNVLISSGEKYGIVKLGKKADKSKLLVKIEYDEISLLSTGDYIAVKQGSLPSVYGKDGKCIAKNVVVTHCNASGNYIAECYKNGGEVRNAVILDYSNGTSKIMSVTVKQDKVNMNLFMLVLLGNIIG